MSADTLPGELEPLHAARYPRLSDLGGAGVSSSATLPSAGRDPERIGRYLLFETLASGGMARVHLGRLVGPVGFSRIVAIKRLHPHLAVEADFVSMFLDEARLAARVRHPNVVPILDVVSLPTELFIVLEYVAGESLSGLLRMETSAGHAIPPGIASAVLVGMLTGLHAAHEAKAENGAPLHIVHRDVSPHNVMVGSDGLPRVLDFGIAYAAERLQMTRAGQIKGKPEYMAPEQLVGETVDRRTDVYGAGVVAWELFTGRRLFRGKSDAHVFKMVNEGAREPPGAIRPGLPPALDLAVMKALSIEADDRFASARDFAIAVERAVPPASQREVAEWVEQVAGPLLAERARRVQRIEAGDDSVVIERPPLASSPDAATAAATEHSAPEVVSLVTGDMSALGPPRREEKEPRRVWLALGGALLGAVLFCAVILVLLVARGNSPDPTPTPAVEPAHSVELVAPFVASTSAAPSAAPPAAPPSASASASASPPPAPPPTVRHTAPKPNPCVPPFTYKDTPNGRVKVPKPQCF